MAFEVLILWYHPSAEDKNERLIAFDRKNKRTQKNNNQEIKQEVILN
jgi:hypothetical protein